MSLDKNKNDKISKINFIRSINDAVDQILLKELKDKIYDDKYGILIEDLKYF